MSFIDNKIDKYPRLGMYDNPSNRCFYNLRLLQTSNISIDFETKCKYLCNGTNKCNGSLNICDFFLSCDDYYLQKCAWHSRAKRRKDRIDFGLDSGELNPEENKCLICPATIENGCNSYVNVMHVADELCPTKAHYLNEIRRGNESRILSVISEKNLECNSCSGKVNSKKCQDEHTTIRDLFGLYQYFPETKNHFIEMNAFTLGS